MNDTPLPITAEDLKNIPRARATRLSYDWGHYGRYTVWIGVAPHFGWSILTDYGKPGQECVVTSPRTREACILALAKYVRDYGPGGWGHRLTIDDWEVVDKFLDARIRLEVDQ